MDRFSTGNPELISNRKLWSQPWGYIEGFYIAFGLMLIGLALEILNRGKGFNLIHYPVNILTLAVLLIIIALLYLLFFRYSVIRWLSTIHAVLGSICLFTFLSLLLGCIKQNDIAAAPFIRMLGISHLTSSFAFAISLLYLLLTSGLLILRRANNLTLKNIAFLISLIGFWVVISCITLGSGDIYRLHMNLSKDVPFNKIAKDNKNNQYEIPFSLKLKKFVINEYNPNIYMTLPELKKFSSEIEYITKDNKHGKFIVEVNKPISLNDWKIYQTGYDDKMGRWSQVSLIEFVLNPWLKFVYAGFGMLLIGAACLLWVSRKQVFMFMQISWLKI